MIVNDITVSITVPIIISILFTTSIHVDVLSSSLKIQYTIIGILQFYVAQKAARDVVF